VRLRAIAVAALAMLAAGLVACGGGSAQDATTTATPPPTATVVKGPVIRIGTKNFTEQFILGELYSQALRAKGYRVQLRSNIGSSELTHQALKNGALDMYPEYVGTLLSEVAQVVKRPKSPDAAYRLAKRFEERSGFTLLAPTPFSDSEALAVTPAYARRAGVRSIDDLRDAKPKPKIGAPGEFETRIEGLVGLRDVYGIREPRYTALDFGARYPSLDSGKVDVVAVFTTERQLAGTRYRILTDPRGLFAVQHVAPIISRKTLAAYGPALRAAIDAVSAKLTTAAMRRMNGAVDIDRRTPKAVATEFLKSEVLL
jgi:osmoprotectant transport system substrate-binding protein